MRKPRRGRTATVVVVERARGARARARQLEELDFLGQTPVVHHGSIEFEKVPRDLGPAHAILRFGAAGGDELGEWWSMRDVLLGERRADPDAQSVLRDLLLHSGRFRYSEAGGAGLADLLPSVIARGAAAECSTPRRRSGTR
jgi:hypothetical protein